MLTSTAPLPALVIAGFDPQPRPPRRARSAHAPSPQTLPVHKALLQLEGRPLIAHVIDALHACPRVAAVTVAGVGRDACNLGEAVRQLPNQPTLLQNLLGGLDAVAAHTPEASHVLLAVGDAPLLSAAAVTWFVDACQARTADGYMAIVERATLEARFPNSGRTWLRTRAGAFCSGDLFVVRPAALLAQQERLRALLARRKQPLALVQTVGVGWLLRFLLGRVHPHDLHTVAAQFTGLQVRPIILPFAGPAMDVDKPHQLEQVRAAHARFLRSPA